MSKDTQAAVMEALRLFGANDFESLAELHDPEVQAYTPRGWPEQGPFEGRDAVIRGLRGVAADWEEHRITDVDVVAAEGGWVVVDYTWRVRGGGSGIEAQQEGAAAYRISDGHIIEIHFCWNRQEALEAAGLRE